MVGITVLLFSGCTKTVYVKTPCPKLQTVELGADVEPIQINYKVVPDGTTK